VSPAGAWDALARLLPAECPRRDLEAVARPECPSPEPAAGLAGAGAGAGAWLAGHPPAPVPSGPRPCGDALARARAAMQWPVPERRLAGRQCPRKLREGGRGRKEGDEGEGGRKGMDLGEEAGGDIWREKRKRLMRESR